MNSKHLNRLLTFLILPLLLVGAGCRTPKIPKSSEPLPPPPPRINIIKIGDFQCENQITAKAVRNVFIEIIGRNRFVKVVREGEADVVIEGTVTYAQAGSAGATGARVRIVEGEYVSGVTSIATRNGEIVTSTSFGQVMSKGGELLPPEYVARRAADRLLGELYRHGLRRE